MNSFQFIKLPKVSKKRLRIIFIPSIGWRNGVVFGCESFVEIGVWVGGLDTPCPGSFGRFFEFCKGVSDLVYGIDGKIFYLKVASVLNDFELALFHCISKWIIKMKELPICCPIRMINNEFRIRSGCIRSISAHDIIGIIGIPVTFDEQIDNDRRRNNDEGVNRHTD